MNKKNKETWAAVHMVLLDELRFRAGSDALVIQPDWLSEFADHLADVVVANFELEPRQRDEKSASGSA